MDERLSAYTTKLELKDGKGRPRSKRQGSARSSSLRNAGRQSLGSASGRHSESAAAGDQQEAEPTPAELEQQQQDFYRKSAEDHREFLLETLKQVKEQLQQPSSLLEATDTGPDSTAVN